MIIPDDDMEDENMRRVYVLSDQGLAAMAAAQQARAVADEARELAIQRRTAQIAGAPPTSV